MEKGRLAGRFELHERKRPALALLLCLGVLCAGADPGDKSPQSSIAGLEAIGVGLPQRGQWRNGFDIGDLNADGIPDLVHGPARKSFRGPVVFLGDGKGGFTRWKEASFPPLPYDYGVVALADFDGDGRRDDIALACHLRGIVVLAGDEQGHFTPFGRGLSLTAGKPGEPFPFCAGALVAADWDRDGRTDLIGLAEGLSRLALRDLAGRATGGAMVFLNRADGWRAVPLDEADRYLIGSSLAVGDVNADGRPDLLSGSAALGFKRILKLNLGDGAAPPVFPTPERAFINAVAMADFDGNGRQDPVIAYSTVQDTGWLSGLRIGLSFPDRFETVDVPLEPPRTFRALAAGNIDGDGQADLAAVDKEGTLVLFQNAGKGRMAPVWTEKPPEWRAGCSGYHVELVDLDRDGRDDVVASFAGEPTPFELATTRRQAGGGIQAWKVRVTPAQP